MARKMCRIGCGRAVATGTGAGVDDDRDHAKSLGICNICLTEAGWENAHSDHGHEDPDTMATEDRDELEVCWECNPELNLAKKPHTPKAGHTNTVAKTRTSHAGHNHAVTPGDRAICRKSMATTGKPYDVKDVIG